MTVPGVLKRVIVALPLLKKLLIVTGGRTCEKPFFIATPIPNRRTDRGWFWEIMLSKPGSAGWNPHTNDLPLRWRAGFSGLPFSAGQGLMRLDQPLLCIDRSQKPGEQVSAGDIAALRTRLSRVAKLCAE